jgi:hypothetical protein
LKSQKLKFKTFGYAFNFQRAGRLSGLKPDVFFGVKKTALFSLAASSFGQPSRRSRRSAHLTTIEIGVNAVKAVFAFLSTAQSVPRVKGPDSWSALL